MNESGVKIYYDLLKIIGWALFPMVYREGIIYFSFALASQF